MRIKLTKSNIDKLKPEAVRFEAWDTEISGFGLRVQPKGERVYTLKYRFAGDNDWLTIGRHGSPWTPDGARAEAKRLLGEVAHGVDPAEKRGADRKAIRFGDLCNVYFSEGVAHKKPSTLRVIGGEFELHLKPLLGAKRADAVTRADIERLLNDVKRGHSRRTNLETAAWQRRQGRGRRRRPVRRPGVHGVSVCRGLASARTIPPAA